MKRIVQLIIVTLALTACGNNPEKPVEKTEAKPVEKPVEKLPDNEFRTKRSLYISHITAHFAEQLTNPQKKKRKSMSQFGYNLSFFTFPLFPITSFINPSQFGQQSYGKPGVKEHNGSLYTCRGSFMDFSHIRCAADWTVFLAFTMITDSSDLELEAEGASLKLHFKDMDKLTLDDVAAMAQKIAFERLVWHEVASWHHHQPNYALTEQQSTFTPEDLYSDLLGAWIGKKIALRILKNLDTLSYSQIATEEIDKTIASLHPLTNKKGSTEAYDIVDRYKQLKLPADKRNKDVWWDSNIVFTDERYVFKRYLTIGPQLAPWLVPQSKQLGCPAHPKPKVLQVPQQTKAGDSFYNYYEFTIQPDSVLFYAKKTGKQLHPPFKAFTTQHFDVVVNQIRKEMEGELLPGFDKRNSEDPVPEYKGVKRVIFE